jgi:general secretion pathway protein I
VTFKRQQGFTLIEMVVAFAILVLALTVLYGIFESTLSRSRHDARLSEGTLIAQSLLARAGTEWPLDTVTRRGEWEGGYAYELAQQEDAPIKGQVPFTLPTIKVTASVTWSEMAGRRTVAVSTLKFLPRERHE